MFKKMRNWYNILNTQKTSDPELISYHTLRKTIGWLGILLPVLLIIGSVAFIKSRIVEPSISHYYYTNMREIFVGILFAVSLFLFAYKGYSRLDNIFASLAGLFALGVALFPTKIIELYPYQENVHSIVDSDFNATIHFTSAALFFFTLAFISIFLFTKSKEINAKDMTRRKRMRNRIYIICGIAMVLSVTCIGIYLQFIKEKDDIENQTVFCFETIALLAFGFSWLTKGEAILKDK